MRVRDIEARVVLSPVRQPDPWFGLRYGMNLYRGCQHRCIYCDSRSECYRIEDFDGEVLVKANALDRLRAELPRKRIKGTVGFGSMNDCYMPLERERELTRRALALIDEHGFSVHVMTKSDLVLRDMDILSRISTRYATVSFSITTADDELGKKVEPGAPLVSRRFAAMRALADRGIQTGVSMMPILPFIEDTESNVVAIVRATRAHGGAYVIPAFGMSLRDRQRAHYYTQLDRLFPGLRPRYVRSYGERYSCQSRHARRLSTVFHQECERCGIEPRIIPAQPRGPRQMSLLE